jgi:hypothetical protein
LVGRIVTFRESLRYRPFALVSPRFVQVDESPSDIPGHESADLRRTAESPIAPFVAVELRVAEGDGVGVLMAGLATADGDHILATYDPAAGRATLELSSAGSTRVIAARSGGPPSVLGAAFVLCENQATVLVDDGTGWQPLVTSRRNVTMFTDLRDPAVLRRYTYAYGVRAPSSSPDSANASERRSRGITEGLRRRVNARRYRQELSSPAETATRLSQVRAGLFGMVGVRDPHLVIHPDGTPYVRDGHLYLTLTCAGLGFFQQAHWGVFTLDLDDLTKLEQVGHLFFRRGGFVLGDHAGQIVVDGNRFVVVVSSWGDFTPGAISVRHAVSSVDVLSGVHVLDSTPLPLPTTVGAWDPALTRIDDRWYVAFVESPTQADRFDFHPALAVGAPGSDYDGPLELIGADTGRHQCEGPILAPVDPAVVSTSSTSRTSDPTTDRTGRSTSRTSDPTTDTTWRVLASDGDAREYPVYDLTMRQVGTLDAPYGSNIPHPQVVTVPGRAGPRHLMITFDGTQYAEPVLGYGGHGDLVILEASTSS